MDFLPDPAVFDRFLCQLTNFSQEVQPHIPELAGALIRTMNYERSLQDAERYLMTDYRRRVQRRSNSLSKPCGRLEILAAKAEITSQAVRGTRLAGAVKLKLPLLEGTSLSNDGAFSLRSPLQSPLNSFAMTRIRIFVAMPPEYCLLKVSHRWVSVCCYTCVMDILSFQFVHSRNQSRCVITSSHADTSMQGRSGFDPLAGSRALRKRSILTRPLSDTRPGPINPLVYD